MLQSLVSAMYHSDISGVVLYSTGGKDLLEDPIPQEFGSSIQSLSSVHNRTIPELLQHFFSCTSFP